MIASESNKFLREFRAAKVKAQLLDDLEDELRLPSLVVERRGDSLMPLMHHYGARAVGRDFKPYGAGIEAVANLLIDYVDHDETVEQMLRLEEEAENYSGEDPQLRAAVDRGVLDGVLILKSLLYDVVCLINWGVGVRELYTGARNGNEESLLKLTRVDKTVVASDWCAQLVRRKQYVGDWPFFARLGKALGSRPISDRKRIPTKAIILVARFWRDKFSNMTYGDIVGFLASEGVVRTSLGAEEMRKSLARAGLGKKKTGRKHRN